MLYRPHLAQALAILLFSCLSVKAAPTIQFGPAPAWVAKIEPNNTQPNLRDVNDGWFMQFVDQQVHVERGESYRRYIRSICSEAGVQGASNISVNFNPAYEHLTFHHVIVWRDGQPIDRLNRSGFKVIANEQDLSMFIYNGNYTAYLMVDDVRKGDKIEYAYTITGNNPVFNKKFFKDIIQQSTEPIPHVHYLVVAAAARQFGFKYFNNAAKPVITNTADMIRYEWDLKDVKGKQYDPGVPSWVNIMPYVQISEYKSWNEVANWAHAINKPVDKLEGTLGKRIDKLKMECGDDSEKLFRQLIDIAQTEVRYMGVEIGPYSHQANRPEKVYDQRYGDCKDKSLLLVSMLRTAGFRASVALTNTSAKEQLKEWLPCADDFNHAIVHARFNKKEVWIDATMSYQGGTGANISMPDYRWALVLEPSTTELSAIQTTDAGIIDYTEIFSVSDSKSPVQMKVFTSSTGYCADGTRQNYAAQGKADLEKNFIDYYSKTYQHIEASDSLIIRDDKEKNELETIESYSIDSFYDVDSNTGACSASFYAATIRDMLPQAGNNRIQPLALSFPYDLRYCTKVEGFKNWAIAPDKQQLKRASYQFTYELSVVNGTLVIAYTFKTFKDHIPPAEIAQYESDRKKIVNDYLSFSYNYTPVGSSAKSGINVAAVVVVIVLLVAMTYAGIRIYRTSTRRNMFGPRHPMTLGGWLILPILGLFVSAIQVAYLLLHEHYFYNNGWHNYDSVAGGLAFKSVLWFEVAGNTLLFGMATFCLVLMFKRRDILPKWMVGFYITSFLIILTDSALASMVLPNRIEFDTKSVFRALVGMAIWIPYFRTSERVRNTFVVSYPSHPEYERPNIAHQPTPEENNNATPEGDHERWKPK